MINISIGRIFEHRRVEMTVMVIDKLADAAGFNLINRSRLLFSMHKEFITRG